LNVTREPGTVTRGDRIAQGIILSFARVEWEEREPVRAETRGGFGSTG
jgi:dUTPase